MTQHTPELDAGARAMACKASKLYVTERDECYVVLDRNVEDIDTPFPVVFQSLSRRNCEEWIDRQAFAAGLAAYANAFPNYSLATYAIAQLIGMARG